jgi:hypothetical protein
MNAAPIQCSRMEGQPQAEVELRHMRRAPKMEFQEMTRAGPDRFPKIAREGEVGASRPAAEGARRHDGAAAGAR